MGGKQHTLYTSCNQALVSGKGCEHQFGIIKEPVYCMWPNDAPIAEKYFPHKVLLCREVVAQFGWCCADCARELGILW